MSQKDLFPHDKLPTTSVHQARLQIFQPTRRPKSMTRSITTPWGSGRVIGKIGQAHADVIEAILRHAHKHRIDDDPNSLAYGALEVLIDPHLIRTTAAGGEGKRLSHPQLRDLLAELMAVVIDMDGDKINPMRMGHIIDEVAESTVPAPSRPGSKTGHKAERHFWYVRLSPSFTRFFGEDLGLFYDPTPIAQLTHGISQAVARHVLTHKHEPNGGWSVDRMLEAVGADSKGPAAWNRRRELLADAEGLAKLGLVIKDGRIRHKG